VACNRPCMSFVSSWRLGSVGSAADARRKPNTDADPVTEQPRLIPDMSGALRFANSAGNFRSVLGDQGPVGSAARPRRNPAWRCSEADRRAAFSE